MMNYIVVAGIYKFYAIKVVVYDGVEINNSVARTIEDYATVAVVFNGASVDITAVAVRPEGYATQFVVADDVAINAIVAGISEVHTIKATVANGVI
jgi:hypothetical protein